ncbi:hypothetical protein [Cellulosilyticum ruminicola]|uniref:hypothetical protein n=1 Tax=Cellulosilyticum ruminicola TaxID=425254 RepID=UPI0006D04848|nr:hypothetical protein [Cellulosilyticum ruminicola]
MLGRLCNKILVFKNKKIQSYEYGLDDYFEHLKAYGHEADYRMKKSKKQKIEEQLCIENKIAYLVGGIKQPRSRQQRIY